MSTAPTRILLTGFGPFPGVADNASTAVVEQLATAAASLPDVRVTWAILPVDWEIAPVQVATLIADERPDIALHFGVSRRARGIVIETLARNCCVAREDTCGRLPIGEKIDDDGAATLAAILPVQAIQDCLQSKGLPVELSEDAGAYLCNAVLYASLRACGGSGALAGFVHLPVDLSETGGDLSVEAAVNGGLEILKACLAADPVS